MGFTCGWNKKRAGFYPDPSLSFSIYEGFASMLPPLLIFSCCLANRHQPSVFYLALTLFGLDEDHR
jgi:hypothetical protein